MAKDDKIFEKEFNGFNKKQVNEYLENLVVQYEGMIQSKDKACEELQKTCEDLRAKYEALSASYISLQEEKAKVANALINAEATAQSILEQAKKDAVEERKALEAQAEVQRSVIVDRNRLLRNMRIDVDQMFEELKENIQVSLQNILGRVEADCTCFQESLDLLTEKYQAEPLPAAESEAAQDNTNGNREESSSAETECVCS